MKKDICLALGFFDSVHFGHRTIIDMLKKRAAELDASAVISTFSDDFSINNSKSKLVYTAKERKIIFSELGLDEVLIFDFDNEFRNKTKEQFLSLISEQYNIRYIVCGYDYRYGRNGSGNVGSLQDFCFKSGIELDIVDKICFEGGRVSTSNIKRELEYGNVERANEMLCSQFFILGLVKEGRGDGLKNQFPTANLSVADYKLTPKDGVYATKTRIDDKLYTSVTNIGQKPTYDDFSVSIETFIDGFSGDLYNREIRVFFYKHLREIQRFDSKEKLREQIKIDLEKSRGI